MEKYVWLFPVIFIVHDMEEIIGYGIWLNKNRQMLQEKYPYILKSYKDYSTEGFALAVFEELLVCIVFCVLAVFTNNQYLRLLWLGGFIACTLHFIIHIGQSIVLRQYIPALITSIAALPISIWIICKCIEYIDCAVWKIILFSIIGIVIVALNLKFAQSLIGRFTRWINQRT